VLGGTTQPTKNEMEQSTNACPPPTKEPNYMERNNNRPCKLTPLTPSSLEGVPATTTKT